MQPQIGEWGGDILRPFQRAANSRLIDIAESDLFIFERTEHKRIAPTLMPDLNGHRVITKEMKDIDQVVPIAFGVLKGNGELQKQCSQPAVGCHWVEAASCVFDVLRSVADGFGRRRFFLVSAWRMAEYLGQLGGELESRVGLSNKLAPFLRHLRIQRPIKRCVDFAEIDELCDIFQLVNPALLQVAGIHDASPVRIGKAGNPYESL